MSVPTDQLVYVATACAFPERWIVLNQVATLKLHWIIYLGGVWPAAAAAAIVYELMSG
jgi:hypothetical protein